MRLNNARAVYRRLYYEVASRLAGSLSTSEVSARVWVDAGMKLAQIDRLFDKENLYCGISQRHNL